MSVNKIGNGCGLSQGSQEALKRSHDRTRKTTPQFIAQAKEVHGNKYDYSKVEYTGAHSKVTIICPKHGNFVQKPVAHLGGRGCQTCAIENRANNKRGSLSGFVDATCRVHGNKYDYSKVIYKNAGTPVIIICKKHGEFMQRPNEHIRGAGCPKCNFEIPRFRPTEDFVSQVKQVHGDKYDYSKTVYVGAHIKVTIICPKHGAFTQTPASHLYNRGVGAGCRKCGDEICSLKQAKGLTKFLADAKKVHGDLYDYSKVVYKTAHVKVIIGCKKHGDFRQSPNNHFRGNGCPICNDSKGELSIVTWLNSHGIPYITQKMFSNCKDIARLKFDFYIPTLNICIEFDGEQHFKAIDWYGGEKALKSLQRRDAIKDEYCKSNGIKMVRIKYDKLHKISDIFEELFAIDSDTVLKEVANAN